MVFVHSTGDMWVNGSSERVAPHRHGRRRRRLENTFGHPLSTFLCPASILRPMHRIDPSQTTTTLEQPVPTPESPGPRSSRAALNLRGLCPVCGDDAMRSITTSTAESRETYRCPVDGETVYVVDHQGRRIQWTAQHGAGMAMLRSHPAGRARTSDPGARFMPLHAAV